MTSYLSENEGESLQNGDVHLSQIPDFEWDISRTIWHIEVSDGSFFVFFTLFHLSLTFFDRSFPLSENEAETYKVATSISLKFLTLEWDISRTIWRIQVSDSLAPT